MTLSTYNKNAQQVFTAKTTAGSSEIHMCRSNAVQIENKGTWDGANITVKYTISGDESKLTALVGVSYTANDVNEIATVPGALIQLTLAAAGASTSLTSWIQDVPKNT